MAFESQSWLTKFVFSLIATFAFLGNSLVLYVLITRRSYLRHSYNVFIFSLAVTDVLAATFLVFSRYLYLPPTPQAEISREIFSRIIWTAFGAFTLGYISVYTCLALTIERWLAVAKPSIYRSIRPHHATKAVILVWIWGILLNIGVLFRATFSKTKQHCTWKVVNFAHDELPWVGLLLQTIFPVTLMVIFYSHIIYTMKSFPNTSVSHRRSTTRATITALAASSALIIGWLPSRITFTMAKQGMVDPNGRFHYSLVVLGFSNSCINPILYGIYSYQFRKEYKKILRKLSCQRSVLGISSQ